MKNLKRALAVLVVVTMMISTVAFASFTDLEKASTSITNAVNVGVGLNLFKGYEDGTFKAEGDITRAEFAAIVVRALGQEAQAAGAATSTSFTDVKADHWAAGYINIVTRLGIVNGYGDGTFGPEDKVLYEQAIKMIVVALGYTPAIGSAGYPVGYLTKAGELGITSGVAGSNGVAANRGTVAQLVFNALDVPMMQQTGYGTNLDYVVQDGVNTNTSRKTIMSEYLDVVKLQVMVKSYEATTSSSNTNNDVKVNILNSYKTKYSEEFGKDSSTYPTNYTLDAGTSSVASLVGAKAFVYVAYDDTSSDTPVVVFATKDTSKTDELTVAGADIDSDTAATATTARTVSYWANDADKKTTNVTLSATAAVYENGVLDTSPTALKSVYGTVTFAKNITSTTEDYDTVFITNFTNVVVDSVNARTFKVTPKNAGAPTIKFDTTDTTVLSTLYDSKGVEMKWTDLKEWDVVSCKVIKGDDAGVAGTKTITVGTLVDNKITGKITEKEPGSTTAKDKFTIDGKAYKIDKAIAGELDLEDEGTFYLDILGRICYYDTTAALNTNYAYIFAASLSTGIDNKTEVKMFTKAGEFVTLKTATKVKLDGEPNIPSVDLTGATPVTVNNVTTYVNNLPTVIKDGNGGVVAGQFITYDVNSSNEITKIDRYEVNTGDIDVKGVFSQYSTTASSEYSASSKSLTTGNSKVYVTDKTIIMVAPWFLTNPLLPYDATTNPYKVSTNEDDYELVNVATIADEQLFPMASFYNVDDNREVGAVLVSRDVTIQSSTSGIAAISGSSSGLNADGDTVVKIKAIQNGEVATLSGSTDFASPYALGSAVIPVLNAKGEVKSFTTLAVANPEAVAAVGTFGQPGYVAAIAANTVTWSAPTDTNKTVYTYGTVSERRTNMLSVKDGRGTDIVIPAGANVYVYDERSSSTTNRVLVGDYTDFDAELVGTTTTYDDDISYVYAISREYEGKIVDVMIYIFKK